MRITQRIRLTVSLCPPRGKRQNWPTAVILDRLSVPGTCDDHAILTVNAAAFVNAPSDRRGKTGVFVKSLTILAERRIRTVRKNCSVPCDCMDVFQRERPHSSGGRFATCHGGSLVFVGILVVHFAIGCRSLNTTLDG